MNQDALTPTKWRTALLRWFSKPQKAPAEVGTVQVDKLKRAELRGLHHKWGDLLPDLKPVRGNFCHELRAEIGIAGETGAEAFEFEVCSTEWLEDELGHHPILCGGTRLFMERFDPDAVEAFVRKRLRHATGANWDEIIQKIRPWARWEFEDYKP